MKISEINEIINCRINYDVIKVSRRRLDDSENKIKICSCNLDINKITGIFNWLEKNKKIKVKIEQHYILSILDHSKNKIKICSCNLDINKIREICVLLEENKERKITIEPHYVLSILVSENIS